MSKWFEFNFSKEDIQITNQAYEKMLNAISH